MHNEKIYQLSLINISGVGDISTKNLISYCGKASDVFLTSKKALSKIPGIGPNLANKIASFKDFDQAAHQLDALSKIDGAFLFYTDAAYPKRLKQYHDAPSGLFFKGNMDLNFTRTIAIVGSRNATDYGRSLTQQLVKELHQYQVAIVSGLAYGIDITAHKQALECGLPTLGIMGTGLERIYPAAHKNTAKSMLSNGGLLTEYKVATNPDPHHFPSRNRIIAAMSDAVVVVEAAKKGGALITAEIANSYNKDVFCFPGNIDHKYSEGCNFLIKRNKAHLITGASDINYIMRWDENPSSKQVRRVPNKKDFNQEEWAVISLLLEHPEGLMIDEMAWRAQFQVSELAALLLNLEFKGHLRTLPGKKYKLNH